MAVPIPNGVGWEVKFLFYVLAGAITVGGGLVAFFIARYIKSNDEHHGKIEGVLNNHDKKFQAQDIRSRELNLQMSNTATKMDQAATKLEASNFKFQQGIIRDLHDMNKATTKIKGDLTECNVQVGSIGTKITDIAKTVDAHHKSLSLGAKALANQKNKVQNIESEVVKLKKDFVMIKTKKKANS